MLVLLGASVALAVPQLPIAEPVRELSAALTPAERAARASEALKSLEGRDATLAAIARGLALYEQGRYRSAARDLAKAGSSKVQVRDVALFFEAESRMHAGQYRRAEGLFRRLVERHPTSMWRHRAWMRVGDCLLARGELAAGARRLIEGLERYPEYAHPASARFAIAEAERRRGRLREAARWYRQVMHLYPSDPLALEAERVVAALEAQGVEPARESADDIFRHNDDLRRRKYWHRALDGFRALLEDPRADTRLKTKTRFKIGRTLLAMERFEESAEAYGGIARDRSGATRRLALRWQSQPLARLGRFDEAAKALLAGSGDPEKPTAETLLAVGWLYFDGARYEEARKWFDRAAKVGRSWASQTRWMRAWLAYRMGEYKVAAEVFKRLQAGSRRSPERYGYWLARALAKAGDLDAAGDTWRGIIQHRPLSYYAYQARGRMKELGLPLEPEPVADGKVAEEELEPDIGGSHDPAGPEEPSRSSVAASAESEPPDSIEPGPPDSDAEAAILGSLTPLQELAVRWGDDVSDLVEVYELAALGLQRAAAMRLRFVTDERSALRRGLRGSYRRRPYIDYREEKDRGEWGIDLEREKRVPSTGRRQRVLRGMPRRFHDLMYDAYRALGDEHYARRHRLDAPKLVTPPEDPKHNAAWRLEYPRAFREIVEERAASRGIDPYFIWALMRVESTYNPWAVSRASARGLMQIMPQTGGLVAARGGWRNFGTALLFEPEVAIDMAAWYFQQLLTKFNGQLALAIPSYNAGPHRVAAWLERKGHLPMDEFIEEIPFNEARGYAKKVLRYLALYRRIYEGDARLAVRQTIDADYRDNINF